MRFGDEYFFIFLWNMEKIAYLSLLSSFPWERRELCNSSERKNSLRELTFFYLFSKTHILLRSLSVQVWMCLNGSIESSPRLVTSSSLKHSLERFRVCKELDRHSQITSGKSVAVWEHRDPKVARDPDTKICGLHRVFSDFKQWKNCFDWEPSYPLRWRL